MADHPLGRGWAFPPQLDNRGRVSTVDADTDIKQSIYIILNTAPGERVMHPDFGCRIHEVLFDPANTQTAAQVVKHVTEALGRWEPRIRVHSVTAQPNAAEVGQLLIEITYEIKDRREIRSLVYPFYLNPE